MIRQKEKPVFTGRMMAYSSVIVILIGVLSYFIFSRSDMDVTIMRSAGMLYQEQPGGNISNVYNAEIINKTNKSKTISLVAEDPAIKIKFIQAPGIIGSGGSGKTVFFIIIKASQLHSIKTEVRLKLLSDNKIVKTVKTTFVGPLNN
jgi:polyferredoxin